MRTPLFLVSFLLPFQGHSHCFAEKTKQGHSHDGSWVAIASAIIVSVSVGLMLKETNHSLLSWQLTETYLNMPFVEWRYEAINVALHRTPVSTL